MARRWLIALWSSLGYLAWGYGITLVPPPDAR